MTSPEAPRNPDTALVERLVKAARHPYKGPNDTDASMLREAAKRLDGGFLAGGSNTNQQVARVCRAVADWVDGLDEAAYIARRATS